jgi:hypothetical protein
MSCAGRNMAQLRQKCSSFDDGQKGRQIWRGQSVRHLFLEVQQTDGHMVKRRALVLGLSEAHKLDRNATSVEALSDMSRDHLPPWWNLGWDMKEPTPISNTA